MVRTRQYRTWEQMTYTSKVRQLLPCNRMSLVFVETELAGLRIDGVKVLGALNQIDLIAWNARSRPSSGRRADLDSA